jgi:hypothetical protein
MTPILACWALLAGTSPVASAPLTLSPPPTTRVLFNPGGGLYAQCGTEPRAAWPADAWWLGVIDIGYFRLDWSRVQPNGPDDDPRTYFDQVFDLWVNKLGKRVAFRVMSENMHSRAEYVTPKWVFDHGVPGVDHVGIYARHQVDPVFWDERYLAAAVAFVKRLGQALDGRPGLEFVDIGQIGEWGEMHLGQHVPGRWTNAQLDATGFSETRYVAAYRTLIDAFAEAFRHTRVFLNVGDYAAINDYAARRGLHFRQDGLNPSGPSANVGERFYKPYSDRGVLGNYEFFDSYAGMQAKGWDLAQTLKVGLSVPLSYLNTNLYGVDSLHRAPPEVRELLTDAARRLGYRFGLAKAETMAPVRVNGQRPSRLPVRLTWVNRGLAPCLESYAIELALRSPVGGAPPGGTLLGRALFYPDPPTTRWAPGGPAVCGGGLRVPGDTPPGTYTLVVRMFEPAHPQRPIQLDLAPLAGDAEGWHEIGPLAVVKVEPSAEVAFHDDFEGPQQAWRPAPGIVMTVQSGGRNGRHGLHVSGTQPADWGLGQVRVPVQPGLRYKLTGWFKVLGWQAPQGAPYLKAGLNAADGHWIRNFETERYDLKQSPTWQPLSVTFDAPVEAASADLAIEKGGRFAVTADLWLGDVTLEVVEGP